MAALIRQAVAFDIDINNPLSKPVTFDVIINGDFLIGESQFFIQPNSSSIYELKYSPLAVGRSKGSIAFTNEFLGEIWYDLNLSCEEQPSVRLPVLRTELGKVQEHEVNLENPSDKEVKI